MAQQELELELGSPTYNDKNQQRLFQQDDVTAEEKNRSTGSTNDNDEQACVHDVPVGDVLCLCKPTVAKGPSEVMRRLWTWVKDNKTQVLSGITVALAQVPEAVSFSFVAGVSPSVGLQSAWIMGLATSWFGGRPGMVAGATGAIASVLPSLVADHGIGYMFYAIMLAGIIQMIFAFLRLGSIVRIIPHPVMVGFCNGLGVVIGVAQFNIFKEPSDSSSDGGGHRVLSELGSAFSPFTNDRPWVSVEMGLWMTFHIAVTLIIYLIFPKLSNAIPSSLAGIIVSTILEHAFVRPIGYKSYTVEDLASVAGEFPIPVWFDDQYDLPPLNGDTLSVILPTAITAAAIGLLESLLTLEIIDELTSTKGSSNRESFGQGLGQFLSGVLGGMGGCTTIGQSLMNIHNGGYTRLSSTAAGLFMLCILLAAYPLINLIPVASLAGVMFVVTYFTIEWSSFRVVAGTILPASLRNKLGLQTKVNRMDVLAMLIVVTMTLVFDLAIGVACGVVFSCLVYSWDAGSRLTLDRAVSLDGETVIYTVSGPVFFGSIKPLFDLFPDVSNDPKKAIILFENAEIYDWSGMIALKKLHEKFENAGVTQVKFEKLSVASHQMMKKSEDLWEELNVFVHQEIEEDPSMTTHLHVEKQH